MIDDRFASSVTAVSDAGSSAQASGYRAFVCALPARNMAHPQRFRTYAVCANAGPDCAIRHAARAMTVALTIFKPIDVAAACGLAAT